MGDIDTGNSGWRRVWFCAAVIAFLIHAGGAGFALTQFRTDDDDDGGLGAAAEVVDIEMGSPKVEENEDPVGVDSVAQNASVATPEQQAQVEQFDAPKDVPNTDTEDADRVVTTSDIKKPTEEQKVAAVQTHASEAADAAEDSSRKALNDTAPETEKTKAPNIGIGKDNSRLTAQWGKKISAYFELHKKFPEGKKKGANVMLALVLNRLGNVLSVNIQESSGDPLYDDAAIAMVRRSDPVPKPPSGLTEDQFAFTLPVNFNETKDTK